jgi:non-specific protein-tyrosine kinase
LDLKEFYRLVLRNLILLVLSTFLGFASAYAITISQTPMYESTTQLFVSTPNSSVDISALAQGSSFSQQRVKSYAQVINGSQTLSPVIASLNLPYTVQDLASRVKATAPLDTVLINVVVQDKDPITAATIANAIGLQFTSTASNLEFGAGTSEIKVSVVKEAIPSKEPASPKKLLNLLLGLILGFGLGVGIALIRIIFDTTLKNEEQLGGFPLLSAIVFDREAKKKPFITQMDRQSIRSESFRTLRTNLQFINPDNSSKVIAITSANPGEGKTTTSLNLALALSLAGFKTIFVEADMRRPSLAKIAELPKSKSGLSDLLQLPVAELEENKLEGYLNNFQKTELKFIAAGKPPTNPSELLNGDNFKGLLDKLSNLFDYIIIDTPPILVVTDAAIISTLADGVVILTHAGKTMESHFKGVVSALSQVNANIYGVVLNKIPLNARDYDNYGYRYGYSYGYRSRYNYKSYYGSETKKEIRERKKAEKVITSSAEILDTKGEGSRYQNSSQEKLITQTFIQEKLSTTSNNSTVSTAGAPIFERPISTSEGFIVNLINYDSSLEYKISVSSGKIKLGDSDKTSLPLIVSNLKPGTLATVRVSIINLGNSPLYSEIEGKSLN